ncbi:DinB family protein [Rhodocytophaga aerolata]|uniref:DinB family protein n=1 Tax=Rhodocytophaga aerolata TaxID=455078 RepID=A0ABT8RAI2_9BACT|nr:DinB family protein [Rhodocytophaga aerolata]MDO1448213.1 DinB family protein [Rhodocytophaga aerolata]
MNKNIEKVKKLRIFLLKQLDGLSTGQLNTIPAGYANNIIWNLGHMLCVEQNLCYVRAGLPITVDDTYFYPYMPGTKPEGYIGEQDIQHIQELLITSLDQLQADYDKKLFNNYSPSVMIPKVYGFEVNNIDEVIDYLLYHEGLHGGYILSLKHLL